MCEICANCGLPQGRDAGECDPCQIDSGLACERRAKDNALAKIAELEAKLAARAAPWWSDDGYLCIGMCRLAVVSLAPSGWMIEFLNGGGAAFGRATEADAKKAAEQACGVEVSHE